MNARAKSPAKSGGRPPIDDHLELVLFVEAGRRRGTKVSARSFLRHRGSIFVGQRGSSLGLPIIRSPLKADALRRRYGEARLRLGLIDEKYDGLIFEDGNPAVLMARETIDRIASELVENDR